MRTLVVHESMWGNSRAVATAIASGLTGEVTCTDVADAPATLEGVDLLVVGGPTHAFSMSRATTRRDAVAKGADSGHEAQGIREWLEHVPAGSGARIATFDTRVGSMRHLPGSAAKSAAKVVKHHHVGPVIAVESFYVADMAGPLLEGELDRAREWAGSLASAHLAS